MNPIDQALSNIQFPEILSHHDMSAYPPIENTPMYLDGLNLAQERIQ